MDVFNVIAPIYGRFYKSQKKRFASVLEDMKDVLSTEQYSTVLDVGCGTGALCDVLEERGFAPTCVDPAQKMLDTAAKKQGVRSIKYINANVLEGLPFDDNSFDVSISSYVAHGLKPDERKMMYAEMSRVTKKLVIIYDYNEKTALFTNIIEFLEGGNYFSFIKDAKKELGEAAPDLKVYKVGPKASWYVFTPSL